MMHTPLHTQSWFSFLRGASAPATLAEQAAALGYQTLALTDRSGVYGAVRFQQACRDVGIRPLFGAELLIQGAPVVLLATDNDGYANLCWLLTEAHAGGPVGLSLEKLDALSAQGFTSNLMCLSGSTESHLYYLLDTRQWAAALAWVRLLHRYFGKRLSIEIGNHLTMACARRMRLLKQLASTTGVPLVAGGLVAYATRKEYRRHDLMACIRLNSSVFTPAGERPINAEAFLRTEAALRKLIPYPEAFRRSADIADACRVDLLPGFITPPAARLPDGVHPRSQLKRLCQKALSERYRYPLRARAKQQLDRELQTIGRLDLDEFFLVVHEIVSEARSRGIRCAGRGSAANSIVAYLLDITGVCPLEHNLLFERFLHAGRQGTPDIDVDFDSDRRGEVIEWMEHRFGIQHTAMTATVVTYGLRMALRDAAKALGWPLPLINKLSKSVPGHHHASRVGDFRETIERVLGASELVDTLLQATSSLEGCPRHLGQHSGGMVLSRRPLSHFTPIQTSANGVRVVQFDKNDVEALGLVKFDVLGLRMLATLSEASEMLQRHIPGAPDIDSLPLDDAATFNLVRSGKTLGVFQIESQGQMHLLAKNQPETFDDLVTEVALFRPGPLQGGMVHPFIRRRQGLEPVRYEHPSLKPVLKDTYGVILFQEQVLGVANHFAGMPLDEADEFRRLMSKFRDADDMEAMRDRFVGSACRRGVDAEIANRVFDQVAGFVGYGFCRSHAAAFARTVYQSAYLKAHFPAPYLAAVMQHRPGMYNLMTLEEEARRFKVDIHPPCIHASQIRYDLERPASGRWAIRKPLTAVRSLSLDEARALLWERLHHPFDSVEDLYRRVTLHHDTLENLARSGALDALAGSARRALWEVGVLKKRLGTPGQGRYAPSLFAKTAVSEADIPALPPLSERQRLMWDYQTHGAARRHPMYLMRRTLNDLEIRPITTCYAFGGSVPSKSGALNMTVAGLATMRQRPPTANGFMFVTLEDETNFIQCIVPPALVEEQGAVLMQSSALIIRGTLQIEGNWRGLLATRAWSLDGTLGGYAGYPSQSGGRDRLDLPNTESAILAEKA